MEIDVGTLIAGKYELVRLIGKGAMGEVWLATHASLGEKFAIKLVEPADDIEAETAAGRFQLEAQIAAKLSRRTRHIVSVSDHGEENGLAYLVMEALEGESLDAQIKKRGRLEVPEVAAMVMQVARALQLAHDEDIFHRDLKPANVFLTRDEDGKMIVKLLDFGIARAKKPFKTRSPFATSKDMVLGTPSYMSPEQARGLDSLDYRCDLWGLAVVIYEALTRTIPFEGETVEDIFLSICTFKVIPVHHRRPDLPPELDAFFARAFAPNIDHRFRSAMEMSDALERIVPRIEIENALGGPVGMLTPRRLEALSRPGSKETLVGPTSESHPDFGLRPGSQPGGRAPSQPDGRPNFARASQPDLANPPGLVPVTSPSFGQELGRSPSQHDFARTPSQHDYPRPPSQHDYGRVPSQPEFARTPSQPDFQRTPSQPDLYGLNGYGQNGHASPHDLARQSSPQFRASQPSYFEQGVDPMPVALGEERRRRGGGWLFIAAGAIVALLLLSIGFVAFRGEARPNVNASTAATTPPTATAPTVTAPPAEPPPIETASAPLTITKPATPPKPVAGPRNAKPAEKPAPPSAPTPNPTNAPTPHVAPPAPAPSPTPAPAPTERNKSGVF